MIHRTLTSRLTFNKLLKLNAFSLFPFPKPPSRSSRATHVPSSFSFQSLPIFLFPRNLHSTTRDAQLSNSLIDPKLNIKFNDKDEDDATTNEFLSRFVWIMRKRVKEAYPTSDKQTIDAMLLVIVERVVSELEKRGLDRVMDSASTSADDFSEDLWKTVWEVSNTVLQDMNKERKKEKMKGFLQCDEVKEMCRFAGEVGIRGDLLRELRFKWAREKMEEQEFYEGLERMRKEAQAQEKQKGMIETEEIEVGEEKPKIVTLPKRRGKIKYKIYGLDLSDPKWEQVADRIHEAGQVMWPPEPQLITGKCKLVTEKIMSLNGEDDTELTKLLADWTLLLNPGRVDWINLLDRLKERNPALYLKVAEFLLTEDSFQTNVSDYYKLIDTHAKENRTDDAERILKKMNENGILPDASTASAVALMYSKLSNVKRARESFEALRAQGFQPGIEVYSSMIMAYVKAGDPKSGEALMREMETRGIKPTKEIYMALLRSYSQQGDVTGAGRISTTMQFAGFQQSMETFALLIEAHALAGDPDQARVHFDYMMQFGYKPDDRCTANMIAAYEKKNLLDKALNLLLELEKGGFEPGVATYSVLVDWLGKLQLVDEAEQLLEKIVLLGEAPPLKVQVSLCDMYARAGIEKKALQTLGVLEARKDELGQAEFERIISGLMVGGFEQDAQRIRGIMEARGFTVSGQLNMSLMKTGRRRPSKR